MPMASTPKSSCDAEKLHADFRNHICLGVLALQGAFREHSEMFSKQNTNIEIIEVRTPDDLDNKLDGLVIPGGESTAFAIVGKRLGMFDALKSWLKLGKPTWGTCAGLIVLANKIESSTQKLGGQGLVGGLDVVVSRNFFGSQVHSFESIVAAPPCESKNDACKKDFPGVFIRAPAILKCGEYVECLATVPFKDKKAKVRNICVAARQGPLLVTAFHPELTSDTRWHDFFLGIVRKHKNSHSK